jgi:hypothetical protein
MGSNRRLIVSGTGLPVTNATWRFIQDAWYEPLRALALMAGDKTILSGVVVTGQNVSDGFVTVNGEILPFVGGQLQTNCSIVEVVESAPYDADANNDNQLDILPIYRTRTVVFGTGGQTPFPFADLTPLKTISELSGYLEFTQAMLNKLNGIEAGAQVNVPQVQADWTVVNPASLAFIKNKPNFAQILHQGISYIGDIIGADQLKFIYFPDVGTTNYQVFITVESLSNSNTQAGVTLPGWNWDNDFSFVVVNKGSDNFQLGFREYSSNIQDLQVSYIIVKL